MLNTIIKNGGATINKYGKMVNLKSGYQVSKKDLYTCKVDELTQSDIDKVVKNLNRGEYAGLWIENGVVYVDISERVATKRDALAVGKARNQISIFNWKKGDCIYCAV